MEENDFVSIWLEESGNPAIEQLGEMNQKMINNVNTAINNEVLSANDLAIMLDINPDEIKRWLAGSQIFSKKTIMEINEKIVPSAN